MVSTAVANVVVNALATALAEVVDGEATATATAETENPSAPGTVEVSGEASGTVEGTNALSFNAYIAHSNIIIGVSSVVTEGDGSAETRPDTSDEETAPLAPPCRGATLRSCCLQHDGSSSCRCFRYSVAFFCFSLTLNRLAGVDVVYIPWLTPPLSSGKETLPLAMVHVANVRECFSAPAKK